MISKYFLWTSALIVNILLFSSCLGSSENNFEYSTDPQIYSISISSRADSTNQLSGVTFSIDQVNGKIFNKKPLPFAFMVDSLMLTINGSSSYAFSMIELTIDADSELATWNSTDSVATANLRKIRTTAADGINKKTYDFQLNIYQQDPYILNWEKVASNYINTPIESQKTIATGGKFNTYYLSGNEIKMTSRAIANESQWSEISLSGIPHTLQLSTMITAGSNIYALDEAAGKTYHSSNGTIWNSLETTYKVMALYSELPSPSTGSILLAVEDEGKMKFAKANSNFSEIVLLNDVPAGMPINNFSSLKVESATSYATKFIYIVGGTTANNTSNNDVWLLEIDNGVVKFISSKVSGDLSVEGSSIFFYNGMPYLLAKSANKNQLMYSQNYGVNWIVAEENQSLPDEFAVRTNSSVITDNFNNIWIFGGISTSNNQVVDIWRGKLNMFVED